jgi:hypothetical protein
LFHYSDLIIFFSNPSRARRWGGEIEGYADPLLAVRVVAFFSADVPADGLEGPGSSRTAEVEKTGGGKLIPPQDLTFEGKANLFHAWQMT